MRIINYFILFSKLDANFLGCYDPRGPLSEKKIEKCLQLLILKTMRTVLKVVNEDGPTSVDSPEEGHI